MVYPREDWICNYRTKTHCFRESSNPPVKAVCMMCSCCCINRVILKKKRSKFRFLNSESLALGNTDRSGSRALFKICMIPVVAAVEVCVLEHRVTVMTEHKHPSLWSSLQRSQPSPHQRVTFPSHVWALFMCISAAVEDLKKLELSFIMYLVQFKIFVLTFITNILLQNLHKAPPNIF